MSNGRVEGCGVGLVLTGGGKTKANNVVAVNNTSCGFYVTSSPVKSKFVNAHAIGNGAHGFQATADGVSFSNCTAVDSASEGIHNVAETDVSIAKNVVLRSGGNDMEEDVVSCAGNVWSGNTFSSRSQSCIE